MYTMKSICKKYFKTVALIWAGCFVLFFFVYMYVLAPQNKTKKQVERQLAEKKQMYESAVKAAQEKTKTQLREQIEQLRNKLKGFVVDFEDSANLTLDISQIAGERKVASFSIKGGKGKNNRRGSEIPGCKHIFENYINISFAAGFNQFAALLNALERHRPVVFVDKFKITRSVQGDSGHPVGMDLAVFVRKRQDSGATNAI